MIQFIKCTAQQYHDLTPNADNFYYLTDTDEFYLGDIQLSNDNLEQYLTQVVAKNESITITNRNEIAVKLSPKAGNNITLQTGSGEEGLYVSVPAATNYTVTVTETSGSASDPYSKRYNVVQSATGLNANIDIPKDMVVSEGSVVDITFHDGKLWDGSTDVTSKIKPSGTPSASDAGKYIKLVIANATSDTIYIGVKDLVDIYTAQPNATQIQLAISSSNVISATVVAGSIGTTELTNGAVTTDKIDSKAVTSAKLSDDVNASLANADSAVQGIATGNNNGEIKYTTDGTNYTAVSIKGLGSAAYTNSTDYATAVQGTKADTAIQGIAEGAANGQIKYTVDGTNYTAVNVHGLGSAAYADTTDFDAAGSAAAVLGTSSDTYTANTVYGAKAYAEHVLEWQILS